MKDTTGKTSSTRHPFHPYANGTRSDGVRWVMTRSRTIRVPKGLSTHDVYDPEDEKNKGCTITFKYEKDEEGAFLPDLVALARQGATGLVDYLFPKLPARVRSLLRNVASAARSFHTQSEVEREGESDEDDVQIHWVPVIDLPSSKHHETRTTPVQSTELLSTSEASSSNPNPQPAQMKTPRAHFPSPSPSMVPPRPEPPSASLDPQIRWTKLRGHPIHTSWHRSKAPYPLTHPPTPRSEPERGRLYAHVCTHSAVTRPVQTWIWGEKFSDRGAEMGWIRVSEWYPHPELDDYRLRVGADGRPSWVTRKTMSTYRSRGRRRSVVTCNRV